MLMILAGNELVHVFSILSTEIGSYNSYVKICYTISSTLCYYYVCNYTLKVDAVYRQFIGSLSAVTDDTAVSFVEIWLNIHVFLFLLHDSHQNSFK